MALPTIRRRLGKLENVFVVDRFAGYPPLTTQEIEALAKRMAEGQEWADVETGRIVKQCPIIQGELLISANRGEVFVKRYLGVDLADI